MPNTRGFILSQVNCFNINPILGWRICIDLIYFRLFRAFHSNYCLELKHSMSLISRLFKWALILGIVGTITIAAVTWFYLMPRLPDVNSLRDYHLQTPLRVMTRDGKLISEFGVNAASRWA